jgi:flagellar hook-basal body complex protein FliE
MSKQQTLNYAETLKQAITDVEAFQNRSKSDKENLQAIKEANEQDCV